MPTTTDPTIKAIAVLVREEIKLGNTPEQIDRRLRIQAEIDKLSRAGLDEFHPRKHYRTNIHE